MARGSKSKYTSKQRRKARHIEEGYEKRGVSAKTAKARAYATVNKQDGGGKKSGSGRKKTASTSRGRRGSTSRSRSHSSGSRSRSSGSRARSHASK